MGGWYWGYCLYIKPLVLKWKQCSTWWKCCTQWWRLRGLRWKYFWCAPKFLDSFKCESKVKTLKEQGAGHAPWLATLWGYVGMLKFLGWGLGIVTSINHSHRLAQNQTSWLMHSWSIFGVRTNHRWPWTHKSHHNLIVYSVLGHGSST